jgi:hypothetical protein
MALGWLTFNSHNQMETCGDVDSTAPVDAFPRRTASTCRAMTFMQAARRWLAEKKNT